ncbi:MAG TPA: twin-arginine translocase subunit TatC [Lacipirellulaceae bacterium]|nr:twin-arginine translocase subunit TatC [Lacipirellulaceae bacterium]
MHRQYNEDLFESTKMTFGEHLDELRLALVKSIVAFVVAFLIALIFGGQVVDYVQTPLKRALKDYYGRLAERQYRNELMQENVNGAVPTKEIDAAAQRLADQQLVPYDTYMDRQELADIFKNINQPTADKAAPFVHEPTKLMQPGELVKLRMYHLLDDDPRVRIIGLRVEEPFVVYLKAAVMLGAVLASPFVFYFIWQFVAAGLYPHEQRYIHIFLPFSVGLFLSGAALAFFGVFRFVLRFFFAFSGYMGIDLQPRITDWLSFVLILPVGFGIAFQLPLVMLFLERIGIFTIRSYLGSWRISVLVIAFLAMVLTPADPYSMMLMMTPLIGLYFFGIMLCWWMPRRATQFEEALD